MSNAPRPPEGNDAAESVTERNFRMLKEHLRGAGESIGGNASRETIDGKLYSCFAVNGYADATGRVLTYGNSQEVAPEIKNDLDTVDFTIRIGLSSDGDERFVGLHDPDGLPPAVRDELLRLRPLYDEHARRSYETVSAAIEAARAGVPPSPVIPVTSNSVLGKLRKLFGW